MSRMNWDSPDRRRIDTRDQNRWEVQAGMRGVHRDTRGNVIGGTLPDGRKVGTKANGGRMAGHQFKGLAQWEEMNPNAKRPFAAGSPANDGATNRRMLSKERESRGSAPYGNTPSLVSGAPKRSWAEATALPKQPDKPKPTQADAGQAMARNTSGGGLKRWEAMNPGK